MTVKTGEVKTRLTYQFQKRFPSLVQLRVRTQSILINEETKNSWTLASPDKDLRTVPPVRG